MRYLYSSHQHVHHITIQCAVLQREGMSYFHLLQSLACNISINTENRLIYFVALQSMLVSLKCIRNPLEITSSLKKQLHLLRELNHENVNKFVGACVEPQESLIVTQYCSRGSLEVCHALILSVPTFTYKIRWGLHGNHEEYPNTAAYARTIDKKKVRKNKPDLPSA